MANSFSAKGRDSIIRPLMEDISLQEFAF